MSRDHDYDEQTIEDPAQLADWFRAGSKGATATLGIGTEHEKLGFDAETLRPLPYEGERGIGALFQQLVDRFGWLPHYDDGHILALERDGAAVTLEPGGQLELSGAVTQTIQETDDEIDSHLSEVRAVAEDLGQIWTHLAVNPWETPDEIPWMPKSRYGTMRRYLGSRGDLAHWMMKTTCTVQANFDYRDEGDALDILALGVRLSPIVTALFARSPVRRGADTGWASSRMEIWTRTDPDRCGVPPVYLESGAGFDEVVQWALDIPMIFVRRDGRYLDVAGTPFRDLMEGRVDGLTPSLGDWELHLSAIFPDVRMKQYIEVRTADAGPPEWLLALPALWQGVLYDPAARAAARALVGDMDHGATVGGAASAYAEGLEGTFDGLPMREVAADLLAIAGAGLDALAPASGSERRYLEPLVGALTLGASAADRYRARWAAVAGDRAAIIGDEALGAIA